jgi:hypothetical protein
LLFLEAGFDEIGADGGLEVEIEAFLEDAHRFHRGYIEAASLDDQQGLL